MTTPQMFDTTQMIATTQKIASTPCQADKLLRAFQVIVAAVLIITLNSLMLVRPHRNSLTINIRVVSAG